MLKNMKVLFQNMKNLLKQIINQQKVIFILGQTWYMRKKYDLAISHFKKSAILYDKAAYMPTLLLHSAISFENTKDKENAKSFYSTLIDLYPNSSEAKDSKKKFN
ncbi:MAG: tetratricopeptide repeat protein [Aliarcobacter sp.]|nr:tetratricopeptide repeat protein [Aliarcobacter sp.]